MNSNSITGVRQQLLARVGSLNRSANAKINIIMRWQIKKNSQIFYPRSNVGKDVFLNDLTVCSSAFAFN